MANKLFDNANLNTLLTAMKPYLGGPLPFVDARAISSVSNSTLGASDVNVYFNTSTKRFVATAKSSVSVANPTYYANWEYADAYDNGDGVRAPKGGRLYVDDSGRFYVGHGGDLSLMERAPWQFGSYSSGAACPDGFVDEARVGDMVLFGTSSLTRVGMVIYKSSYYIYIAAYDSSGLYSYNVNISTATITSVTSKLFSSYATTSTVNALTTRVTNLENNSGSGSGGGEARPIWVFEDTRVNGKDAPAGFVSGAAVGDMVMMGTPAATTAFGIVVSVGGSIHITALSWQNVYHYAVDTNINKITTADAYPLTGWATASSVSALTTRVTALENSSGGGSDNAPAVWLFSSYAIDTVLPTGFTANAKIGDIVVLGTGRDRHVGTITHKTTAALYANCYATTGHYLYTFTISSNKITAVTSTLFSNYATEARVNGLNNRIATLEANTGSGSDIDTTALPAIWKFSSYARGTAAPDGFFDNVKLGDICVFGNSSASRVGVVGYAPVSKANIGVQSFGGNAQLFAYYIVNKTQNAITTATEQSIGELQTHIQQLLERVVALEAKVN